MKIQIEYGHDWLSLEVPPHTLMAGMKPARLLQDPAAAIKQALTHPIGTPPLADIARSKLARKADAQAVIVVSDHTRPVPYRGEEGLMLPLLSCLKAAGFREQQITVLIGAGSHRNMQAHEIEAMLGLEEADFSQVQVLNHEYDRPEQLVDLGSTRRGSRMLLNKTYVQADLKIVTGLVESHFMAGASGGRKGICPGIVGQETLHIFHGGRLLNAPQATDLVLEGNPLHEEASEVAQKAGCDFLLNVSLDADKRLTGVFAGDLFEAHREAVRSIRQYVSIPLDQLYDIVLIPAGYVGVNHYQAVKAAIEAARAVRPGGVIILVAKHTDADVLGGPGYKKALKLLHQHGRQAFMDMILDEKWELIQEQWQVQMWCRVLERVGGHEQLLYCCMDIPREYYRFLPGTCMMSGQEDLDILDERSLMENMLQRALNRAIRLSGKQQPDILFLKDGPYGIPELRQQPATPEAFTNT